MLVSRLVLVRMKLRWSSFYPHNFITIKQLNLPNQKQKIFFSNKEMYIGWGKSLEIVRKECLISYDNISSRTRCILVRLKTGEITSSSWPRYVKYNGTHNLVINTHQIRTRRTLAQSFIFTKSIVKQGVLTVIKHVFLIS